MWDSMVDLAFHRQCAGCGLPGRSACNQCRQALRAVRPQPCLAQPDVMSAHPYDWPVRGMIVAYKEKGMWQLASVLSERLAACIAALLGSSLAEPVSLVLVPAPSRAASVRHRGLDTTAHLARGAARVLRRSLGIHTTVQPVVRFRRKVSDQADLNRRERDSNMRGSMRACAALAPVPVILVDDVFTTGATLREVSAVSQAHGWQVWGSCVVASVASPSAQ